MTEIRACVRVSHVRACAKKICRLKNYIYLCLEIKFNIMEAKIFLRRYESVDGCTFGHLSCGLGCVDTLEKTSKIIPEGTYELVRRMSPSFGRKMWYLKDVPGRSGIMIHSGNTLKDTNGCILVGVRNGITLVRSCSTLALLYALLSFFDKVTLIVE